MIVASIVGGSFPLYHRKYRTRLMRAAAGLPLDDERP